VATADYKAVDMTKLTVGNVKKGVSIAGVTGDYPSYTYPLTADTAVADLDHGTFEAKLAGATEFEWFDRAGGRKYRASGDTDLTAANIKSGVSIWGVTGNLAVESHSDCASDGATGCVAVTAFKAVDMTKLTAANVKKNVSIAGVTGNYPSSTYPLAGDNPSVDTLTTTNFNSKVTGSGYFEWWGADGQVMWLSSGDTDIAAGNIKSGVNIFGVAGNVTAESHNDCSSDAQIGCITTASYKAANMTNVTAGNVKDGVVIAGITGDYPSSTYPLSGASATADLDSATFNAKVKASTSFEYWNSAGTRQTGAGDADITAANVKSGVTIFGTSGTYAGATPNQKDIRAGVTINGVAGTLKANCRNTVIDARYNYDGSVASIPNTAVTSGSVYDWWDTGTDYNNGGSFPAEAFPSSGSPENIWSSDSYCGASNFSVSAPDGSCDTTGDQCTITDLNSGMMFSEIPTTQYDWNSAIVYCADLSHAGYDDWRLPTQKELMTAYVNGIGSVDDMGAPIETMYHAIWGATTADWSTASATITNLVSGGTEIRAKTTTTSLYAICIREP
jgi:hypothetical protein